MYAGEEVFISTVVEDFDGIALADVDVISVQIATIVDSSLTEVRTTVPMAYDATAKHWFYMWSTAGLSSGTYKAKVLATGLDGSVSWEWKRIRLARDLLAV